ncbi:hypothetical protein LRS71_09305 [Rhodococcus pyridinivorans]|uniref:hypothetical protein n=1 Tax=Rhodococcus pyridinivorans TaxID=103816 RepID=UPI001E48CD70|nr:hypothetical protein [Rhodococcus pyridinivorans]MCD5419749.1 hypothetical protein [Rhodococcus pyridinivorans]
MKVTCANCLARRVPESTDDGQAEDVQTALAGLVQENNELRAIIRRVREYAQTSHQDADDIRKYGNPYAALPYENAALALERIIGDLP